MYRFAKTSFWEVKKRAFSEVIKAIICCPVGYKFVLPNKPNPISIKLSYSNKMYPCLGFHIIINIHAFQITSHNVCVHIMCPLTEGKVCDTATAMNHATGAPSHPALFPCANLSLLHVCSNKYDFWKSLESMPGISVSSFKAGVLLGQQGHLS